MESIVKKKKLYDFSAGYLAVFVISYFLLFALVLYNLISGAHPAGAGMALGVILITFIVIIIRFGFMTAEVWEDRIRKGKLIIKKSNAMFLSKYDVRFRESVIVIRDRSVEYVGMNRKERTKNSITVQATPHNRAILSGFFGVEIEEVRKPKRKK